MTLPIRLAIFASYNYIVGYVGWRTSFLQRVVQLHILMAMRFPILPWQMLAYALHTEVIARDMTLGIGAVVNRLETGDETAIGQRFHLSNGTNKSGRASECRNSISGGLVARARDQHSCRILRRPPHSDKRTGVVPGTAPIERHGIDPTWGVSVGGSVMLTF